MQFPITIGLHRSRILDVILCLIVMLAVVSSLAYQTSALICAGLIAAILILATLAWRALVPTIKAIRLERNGDILMARAGQHDFALVSPEPGATIHPCLTVIRLRTAEGRTDTLLATIDRVSQADFRHLRMFMRWQANFSGPDAAA